MTTVPDLIQTGPLVDALLAAGIEANEVGGSSGGESDGGTATSTAFRLSDDSGTGSAAVGFATSVQVAPMMNETSVGWCAVAPTGERDYAWSLADDPATPCSDADLDGSQPLVVVHEEPGAAGIGATLVRADGSVLTVSVSQAPADEFETVGDAPLAALPMDRAAILDLLAELDAANPVS